MGFSWGIKYLIIPRHLEKINGYYTINVAFSRLYVISVWLSLKHGAGNPDAETNLCFQWIQSPAERWSWDICFHCLLSKKYGFIVNTIRNSVLVNRISKEKLGCIFLNLDTNFLAAVILYFWSRVNTARKYYCSATCYRFYWKVMCGKNVSEYLANVVFTKLRPTLQLFGYFFSTIDAHTRVWKGTLEHK